MNQKQLGLWRDQWPHGNGNGTKNNATSQPKKQSLRRLEGLLPEKAAKLAAQVDDVLKDEVAAGLVSLLCFLGDVFVFFRWCSEVFRSVCVFSMIVVLRLVLRFFMCFCVLSVPPALG